MPIYEKIPVDTETKKKLVVLAETFGLGKRGQGAMVRILVNEKLQKLGLAGTPTKDESIALLPVVGEEIEPMPAVDDVA